MIYNLPIEPYEERYTEQWIRWIPEAFKKVSRQYTNVLGEPMTSKIEIGKVLDVYGTNYFKQTQLARLIKIVREDKLSPSDIIFVNDLWFPGIEALQYIRNMTKGKWKIYGILHAGTWDINDFTYKSGMCEWAYHMENGWLTFADKIFVGSEYHKNLIVNSRIFDEKKIVVTGLPFKQAEVSRFQGKKENIVVFPHRLDEEKRPDLFDKLKFDLKRKNPHWKFIKTKDVCKTKEDYYQLLGKAKIAVSFAEQETFGFAMLEAMSNNCRPLVPNALAYKTMDIYNGYRFENYRGAVEMCQRYIDEDIQWRKGDLLKPYEPLNVIRKMLSEK